MPFNMLTMGEFSETAMRDYLNLQIKLQNIKIFSRMPGDRFLETLNLGTFSHLVPLKSDIFIVFSSSPSCKRTRMIIVKHQVQRK